MRDFPCGTVLSGALWQDTNNGNSWLPGDVVMVEVSTLPSKPRPLDSWNAAGACCQEEIYCSSYSAAAYLRHEGFKGKVCPKQQLDCFAMHISPITRAGQA